MIATKPTKTTSRRVLDRLLRPFADVREGEGAQILLLAFNIFLILTAYYVMKPVREALILAQPGGAEIKSYSMAIQALLLVVIVPAYGALATRLSRRRLINSVTALFIFCLPVFYVAAESGHDVGITFFLWIGVFSLMVIAQFWAYANDLYTPEAGKRLFALVAFGASSGAVFGAFISSHLINLLGVYPMLLVAGGVLVISLLLFNFIDRRTNNKATGEVYSAAKKEAPIGDGNAFGLVFRNRYLLLIAGLILFLNWVNATGEYILSSIVSQAAEAEIASGKLEREMEGAFIGAFYAQYFQVVNIVGMLLQLFLVSRLVNRFGVHIAVCILPAIAFGSYLAAALVPSLAILRWVKTAENSVDYSLQNTVAQMLYLPTTREEKYKAKQVTDTFVVRAGDILSSVTVLVGTSLLAFSTSQFAMVNAVLVLFWFAIAVALGREFQKRAEATAEAPV